jgi:hypothetical protein
MKIPIQLQFKLFDDIYVIKKKVDDIHINDIAEMYKSVFVPVFGQESYENAIISIAEDIKKKRDVNKPVDKNIRKNIWVYLKKLCKFMLNTVK